MELMVANDHLLYLILILALISLQYVSKNITT